MWADQLAALAHVARRAVPALGLAATLLVAALGPPASPPAHGQTERDRRSEGQQTLPPPPPGQPGRVRDHRDAGSVVELAEPRDPVTRLQLIVNSVHILDDHDWHSEGDLMLEAILLRCSATDSCFPDNAGMHQLTQHLEMIDADSDETVPLNFVIPKLGDQGHHGYDLSERAGYPIYAGAEYLLWLDIYDVDDEIYREGEDDLGRIYVWLTPDNGWGVDTYTIRSFWTDGGPADYFLDFEIRRTPLPDLRAREIRGIDAGALQYRCAVVDNVGAEPSGLFQLAVRRDGTLLRTATLPALEVGASTEHCVLLSELGDGQRELSFVVDEGRQVPEMDEANNRIAVTVDSTPPPTRTPMPTPTPAPSAARPDLTVSAIKVRGKVPDGKDDCKDGKNDVVVVVKNGGGASAGAFAVRLQIDGATDQMPEKALPDLEAGTEREVRFDDLRLKKGEHKLEAIADAEKAVAESDEGNNARTASARCKDDD